MIDRRTMLLAGGATVATAAVPDGLRAKAAGGASLRSELDAIAAQVLVLAPEQATGLGVDNGANAGLKAKLSRYTPADDAAWAKLGHQMIDRLDALSPGSPTDGDRLRRDAVRYTADRMIDGTAFGYGGGARAGFFGGARPYTISQQGGALTEIPEFLDSQHIVATPRDAGPISAALPPSPVNSTTKAPP